jgi:hypothetical protein
MANQYGPWATLIDAAGNAQLSAFWRRRLVMLVPVSESSPSLSRRSLVCLFAAGALMFVLPTFRVAALAAEEEKPARIRKDLTARSVQEKNFRSAEQMPSEQPANRDQGKEQEKRSPAAQAAQHAYEATVEAYHAGLADFEAVYRWSRRWMQAEQAERGDAAIQSHLDRMQTFYSQIKVRREEGLRGGEEANFAAAHYYVVEAKDMLKQAKKSPTDRPVNRRD